MESKYIIELLYQQIRADRNQIILERIKFKQTPEEISYLIVTGGIDNWSIILDSMGFPDESEENTIQFSREWLYKAYYKVLQNSFTKNEEQIKSELQEHYSFLQNVSHALKSNNKDLLETYRNQVQ